MIEFYAEIRLAHVSAAIASGLVFLVRGLLVQAGRSGWALAPLPRYLSYTVDTALLTAALMLVSMLPAAAFGNGWLAAKLALLPVYVALGYFALRAAAPRRRLASLLGAAGAYLGMYAIARAHDPLGPFRGWLA